MRTSPWGIPVSCRCVGECFHEPCHPSGSRPIERPLACLGKRRARAGAGELSTGEPSDGRCPTVPSAPVVRLPGLGDKVGSASAGWGMDARRDATGSRRRPLERRAGSHKKAVARCAVASPMREPEERAAQRCWRQRRAAQSSAVDEASRCRQQMRVAAGFSTHSVLCVGRPSS
jgi:hypothetical protein